MPLGKFGPLIKTFYPAQKGALDTIKMKEILCDVHEEKTSKKNKK
jgi:hypothetical protein